MRSLGMSFYDAAPRTPSNLAEAEEMFGVERVQRAYRKPSRQKKGAFRVSMAKYHCSRCGKVGYLNEIAARIVISDMLRKGMLTGPSVFTFKPYLCLSGYWHNGHDYKAWVAISEHIRRREPAQAA